MYQLNPNILQTPLTEDNILLLQPGSGKYFEVSNVSCIIYLGVKQGQNKDKIIHEICQQYDVDLAQAKKDFEEFIQQLLENHIIEDI